MQSKRTLTAVTPFGTFTRTTASDYKFVALAYHADGTPVREVGARAGKSTPFLARWSRTADGAAKLAESYPYDRNLSVHGPYAVEEN